MVDQSTKDIKFYPKFITALVIDPYASVLQLPIRIIARAVPRPQPLLILPTVANILIEIRIVTSPEPIQYTILEITFSSPEPEISHIDRPFTFKFIIFVHIPNIEQFILISKDHSLQITNFLILGLMVINDSIIFPDPLALNIPSGVIINPIPLILVIFPSPLVNFGPILTVVNPFSVKIPVFELPHIFPTVLVIVNPFPAE